MNVPVSKYFVLSENHFDTLPVSVPGCSMLLGIGTAPETLGVMRCGGPFLDYWEKQIWTRVILTLCISSYLMAIL